MKKLIIIILLLVSSIGFSQDTTAKKLLDEVSEKVKSYDNIGIDFKYALNNIEENINQPFG